MEQFPFTFSVPFKFIDLAVELLMACGHYNAAIALAVAAVDCIQVYDAQAANHMLTLTINDDEIHVDCTKTL